MQEKKKFSEKGGFERLSEGLVDDTGSSLGDLSELLSGHKSPNDYAQDEFDFTDLPVELRDQIFSFVPENEKNKTPAALVASCKKFYNTFQPERLITKFLQAVVDDDREAIKEILDEKPQLLLIDPPANLVIKSKFTHQQFYAENPLKMAASLKQIEMVKILLPYYRDLVSSNKLEQCVIDDALSAWKTYEMLEVADNCYKITIPNVYHDYANLLVKVFVNEKFPNGVPHQFMGNLNVDLGIETKSALCFLYNILVPKNPIKLDNHIDVELFLVAALRAFLINDKLFENLYQREAFCVRVIGLIQCALSPETGKILCQGIHRVVDAIKKGNEIELTDRASICKLDNDENLYRPSRALQKGLGINFYCYGRGDSVVACDLDQRVFNVEVVPDMLEIWTNHIKQKQQIFKKYTDNTVSGEPTLSRMEVT